MKRLFFLLFAGAVVAACSGSNTSPDLFGGSDAASPGDDDDASTQPVDGSVKADANPPVDAAPPKDAGTDSSTNDAGGTVCGTKTCDATTEHGCNCGCKNAECYAKGALCPGICEK